MKDEHDHRDATIRAAAAHAAATHAAAAHAAARRAAELAQCTAAEAWRDLFDAVDADTRRALGLVHRSLAGGTLLAAPGIDHLMFNRLMGTARPTVEGAALEGATAEAAAHSAVVSGAVEAAVEAYERLGVPRYLLSFGSHEIDTASAAGTRLGLVRFHRAWATLTRPSDGSVGAPTGSTSPEAEPPASVRVRPAAAEDAVALGALLCRGFAVPERGAPVFAAAVGRRRWGAWVAEVGSRLVGAGLLFTNAGCAFLFAGATELAFRRRGIQRALIAERIRAASFESSLIASETGVAVPGQPNPSWRNLVAAGLRPVHLLEHLCPPGSAW